MKFRQVDRDKAEDYARAHASRPYPSDEFFAIEDAFLAGLYAGRVQIMRAALRKIAARFLTAKRAKHDCPGCGYGPAMQDHHEDDCPHLIARNALRAAK